MLCALILYISSRTCSYHRLRKTNFLETFSWQVYLPAEICWKEIAEEIYFFHISFWWLNWETNSGFMTNEPTHYLIDYGDYRLIHTLEKPPHFNQDYNLASHNTPQWPTSNHRFLIKCWWQFYFSLGVLKRRLLKVTDEIFFIFRFIYSRLLRCPAQGLNHGLHV